MDFNVDTIKAVVLNAGYNVAVGLIVIIIGMMIVKMMVSAFSKVLDKKNVDVSLKPFLTSNLSWVLKLAVVIAAANTAGVETTSFVALLGTAGLAIGMALQGSLSNFAGGVLILLLKPFKVGDVITAQGHTGKVHSITTFATILKTPDNKTIILPNGGLAGSSIVNVSTEATRRVDFVFGIGYEDDIDKAKSILADLVSQEKRVLTDKDVVINVAELADSSVNLNVRVWSKSEDYWGIFHDLTEKVKKEFDKQSISIPYPQRDIHVHQVQ